MNTSAINQLGLTSSRFGKTRFAAAALSRLAFTLGAQAQGNDNRAPAVPASLTGPDGNKVDFHADAIGFQIYTWNGTSWGTSVPAAVPYDAEGNIVGTP